MKTQQTISAFKKMIVQDQQAFCLIVFLCLLFSSMQLNAQDYILMKAGQLLEGIVKDDTSYLTYQPKPNPSLVTKRIPKNLVQNYSIRNKPKKRPGKLEIIDKNGNRKCGYLLYADGDSLYFWNGNHPYHPNKGEYLSLNLTEVQSIAIHRKGNFGKGFVIGFACGVIGSAGLAMIYEVDPGTILSEPFVWVEFSIMGLFGGMIGLSSRKHIQYDSFSKMDLDNTLTIMQKYAMLSSPPIYELNKNQPNCECDPQGRSIFRKRMKRLP